MSIPILKERTRVTETVYALEISNVDGIVSWSFACDKNGVVSKNDNSEQAYSNYKVVMSRPEIWPYRRVKKDSWSYIAPAIAKCHCGKEIELIDEYLGACECLHCGKWYNMYGQELNSPETWPSGDDYDYDY